ncbi:hypothetical protein H1230_16675 [Paenibacillus sp. 19GGS1-52]|uniref:hypothetical protein n=1 Tax=Paenibacillus sp. 19GGS1-52 TaxID=2758563 RepID=UPI001EFAE3C0|nr:hypothetical protein [Paenibacillus sp. 19GGS1-52]ULO04788.1 hypothetical protein H1230_16675 [Paenibacillus sp. 19GGS1-52]
MLIYENEFPELINTVSEILFPNDVKLHIKAITEDSSSKFYCRIDDEASTVYVYLLEHNLEELYTICHLFSYDHIGSDYLYQSLPLEQIKVFLQLPFPSSII